MSVQNLSFLTRLDVAEKFVVVVGWLGRVVGWWWGGVVVVVQAKFRVQL